MTNLMPFYLNDFNGDMKRNDFSSRRFSTPQPRCCTR